MHKITLFLSFVMHKRGINMHVLPSFHTNILHLAFDAE